MPDSGKSASYQLALAKIGGKANSMLNDQVM